MRARMCAGSEVEVRRERVETVEMRVLYARKNLVVEMSKRDTTEDKQEETDRSVRSGICSTHRREQGPAL